HGRDIEDCRILAAMRMLGAVVEVQGAHLVAAERTARDHALDSLLDNALGEPALEDLSCRDLLEAAGIAGVLVIELLLELAAGKADFVGIDDDDMIAAIDVRSV